MDTHVSIICDAIKKICLQIKPQINPSSFILLIGLKNQGKTALLRQSGLQEYPLGQDHPGKLYYNNQGIVLELGEAWLAQNAAQFKASLKQLNRCHHAFKVSGIAVCIDSNELLNTAAENLKTLRTKHLALLEKIEPNLGYHIDLFLFLTKIDNFSGFAEFYDHDHETELSKPLGFSLNANTRENFVAKFDQFIETLNEQVINKIHPARTTIKRTLIREFPAQISGLKLPLQSFLQESGSKLTPFRAIFLSSAVQGGLSVDRINQKIEHEYALCLQNHLPLATNYKAYFIQGAFQTVQAQCLHHPEPNILNQRLFYALGTVVSVILFAAVFHHFVKTRSLLDEASKELLAYETLNTQQNKNAQALYHLNQAAHTLDKISANTLASPTLFQLQSQIHYKTNHEINSNYIPELVRTIEHVIANSSETPIARYKALKIYLMLNNPNYFSKDELIAWVKTLWASKSKEEIDHNTALLNAYFDKPLTQLNLNDQLITDVRNYLNALPTSYLYYSIAKESFDQTRQQLTIAGIDLASPQIPDYFTREGFDKVMQQLPAIAKHIEQENWILQRQDLAQMEEILKQTYCYDYVTWWQTFLKKSAPKHYQNYHQGQEVASQLEKNNSILQLITLVQNQTRPDLQHSESLFNQAVASQFTELNLMSQSATRDLGLSLQEIAQFMTTLAVVNDQGKTAFSITKGRFSNTNLSDPVSMLYTQSNHFPEPINKWVKQVADDCWVLLINDARGFINQQWQRTVYRDYQQTIVNRYPLDATRKEEIALEDFNHFFSTHGILNQFVDGYIKPFLDTAQAQWQPKAVDGYVMPISPEMINELIRANVITTMFFGNHGEASKIDFTLHKITLDPIISELELQLGKTKLNDNQNSESETRFIWPNTNARLALNSIDGNHYEIAETGVWSLFKLLEKVNVLVDEQDSASLHILFEINGNSGRYLLKSENAINPFTPGILNGFELDESVV